MRRPLEHSLRAAALAAALAALCPLALAAQGTDSLPRQQRWREDLAFLARELPAGHKDPFTHTTRAAFDSAVAALDDRISVLTDGQVVLELSRIIASLRDPHTSLRLNPGILGLHALPISITWFDDGLFITAADASHAELAGARLLAINGVAAQAAALRAAAYIPWDNDATLRSGVPGLLVVREVLELAGVVPEGVTPLLRISTAKGEQTVAVEPVALLPQPLLTGPLTTVKPPLFQSNPRAAYWYRLLDDSTLYFQYNRCADDPERPLSLFTAELLSQLHESPVRRVIVDLRLNGGGNSYLLRPFENGIKAWLENTPDAQLYALTSRRTFSSALMNAHELKQLGATLVGQPTGGRPNHFGELKLLQLPHSKLSVSYSTKYFILVAGEDPESLLPDVPVPLLSTDVFSGRDPVLERLLGGAVPAPAARR